MHKATHRLYTATRRLSDMSAVQFSKVYAPGPLSYPALLRHLVKVNALLSDHIPAPNAASTANTMRLYDALGRPLDRIPTVLVGGTNGKGTTCLKLATALQVSGLKTGLFVSPHISSFRERVQVDARLIEEAEVLELVPRVLEICRQQQIPATFFEITFALACLQFEASSCDAVVLEVGVGGEWDATNVCAAALSIICSVDLDHVRFLGPTVEAIAVNKAGIFKPHRPSLMGPGCPQGVLVQEAAKRDSVLFSLPQALALVPPGSPPGDSGGPEDALYSSDELDVNDVTYTDKLNSKLAYAGLKLLKYASLGQLSGRGVGDRDLYACFSSLDLQDSRLRTALRATAPCRWERLRVPVTIALPKELGSDSAASAAEPRPLPAAATATREIEVVLDIGHNPAAIAALMRRAKLEFAGKRVR
jgi:folylpolyglutamate synthase/dihydropteroate synthase